MAVAERVLAEAAPKLRAPEAIRDVTDAPRWLIAADEPLSSKVVEAVQDHSRRGLFVGVIALEDQWQAIRDALGGQGIRWSESVNGGLSQGINLVSPVDSKGLEFDAVVVVDPARILDEAQGAKLLYIALTRTVHYLDVVMPATRIAAVFEEFVNLDDQFDAAASSEPRAEENGVELLEVELAPTESEDHDVPDGPELGWQEELPRQGVLGNAVASEAAKSSACLQPVDEPLSNPVWENLAHDLADRIAEDLEQNAGPAVRRRILELLQRRLPGVK